MLYPLLGIIAGLIICLVIRVAIKTYPLERAFEEIEVKLNTICGVICEPVTEGDAEDGFITGVVVRLHLSQFCKDHPDFARAVKNKVREIIRDVAAAYRLEYNITHEQSSDSNQTPTMFVGLKHKGW